ncbi:UDP-2,3-diacylglucosamine diphosphatase [bacterium]|nr:UDP-2,3-diacylglucosamine diphosphatase [bacterium]
MTTAREKIYFISDVHLGASDTRMEQTKHRVLKSFFDYIQNDASELYILGDYFDFWFEYKHAIPKQCVSGVHLLMQLIDHGVSIHYLSGNHDHWVQEFFEKNLGITVYPASCTVELDKKQIFLCHGDGLSDLDKSYRIMKVILRNKLNVQLYRWLHPDLGIPLANTMSRISRNQDRDYKKYINDPSIHAFLQKKFSEGVDIIIMGHHHQPKEEHFEGKKYINLGDWIHHFTYGEWSHDTVLLKKWTKHEIL